MLQRYTERVKFRCHDACAHGRVVCHERARRSLVFRFENYKAKCPVRRGPCQSYRPRTTCLLQMHEMAVDGGGFVLGRRRPRRRPGQVYYINPCRHIVLLCHSSPSGDSVAGMALLYTSDAADEEDSVDLGGRRIIKKK